MNKHSIACLFALLGSISLAGCGGGSNGSGTPTGTLKVSMTDAPSCGYDRVFVTVAQIRVNANANAGDNDAGRYTINIAAPQKTDLLTLSNGVLAALGQTALPVGQYQQVRLVLAQNRGNVLSNSVVPTGGSEQALDTPSATQSGYKIIRPFTVQPNTLVDLVLDFDACRSVTQRGNSSNVLKPVVTATPAVVSGAIAGYVLPGAGATSVYAEQNGQIIKGTVADSTGHFVLSPLESAAQGPYDIVFVRSGAATGVVQSVLVVVNTNTTISSSQAPVPLPASPMASAGGNVTASAAATLRALQVINGVTYVIASTNANLDTGAYTFALPTTAPLVATYSGSTPVAFVPAPNAAGQCTLQATTIHGAT